MGAYPVDGVAPVPDQGDVGPCTVTGPCPASRARRLVRPTMTRSVATDTAAAANRRFSSNWRSPSSTIPGVTTANRGGPADESAPPGAAETSARRAASARAGLAL